VIAMLDSHDRTRSSHPLTGDALTEERSSRSTRARHGGARRPDLARASGRPLRLHLAALALPVAATLLVPRAVAAWPNNLIKTKVTIPFNGVLYHPATTEHVAVSGALAVQTVVKYIPPSPILPENPIFPPVPVKVSTGYKIAPGTTAIGQTSGASYTLKGTGKTQYFVPANPVYPGNPIRTVTQAAVLHMFPSTPVLPNAPIKGFRLQYQINFDDNGVMTGSAAAVVPDSSAPCAPVASVCSSEQPLPSLCTDGVTDQDETDVDCGGATCSARCPLGAGCAGSSDCASGLCTAGVCACVAYGGVCSSSGQCCDFGLGVVCISGHCTVP
jgi:hypothetical protein